jgi:crossover junction endodeoxyribonuclease RuvC
VSYILGIDPGQEGAFVLLDRSGHIVQCKKIPTVKLKVGKKNTVQYDTLGIIAYFNINKSFYPGTKIFIEEIHAAPGQGVTSMFTMGYGFGLINGIVLALGYPVTRVAPQEWKKNLLKGMPKEKMASVVVASRLFPDCDTYLRLPRGGLDHNVADALLIAEWGRRNS